MQHSARHIHHTDRSLGNGKVTDLQLPNITRAEPLNASLSGVLYKPGPRNTYPSLARHRSVHRRHGGTRVHDHSRRMAVERGRHLQVIGRVPSHRNSSEPSAGKQTGHALTDCGTRTVWINVKHLASAIDNHPKFAHLPGAEQTIEMRQPINCRDMRSRGSAGRVRV